MGTLTMTSFVEFLKTGRLGPVSVGMARDDVRMALGEPRDVSVNRFPRIWKYGPLQLTFYKSTDESEPFLASIVLHFYSDPMEHLPEGLALTDWGERGPIDYSEFRDYLTVHGISVVGGVTAGPRKHLVLPSAVRVSFDEDQLYSVGYDLKREPEVKQLTVKVRRKDLEAIQKWARGLGMSAPDLCSQWIRERVSTLERSTSP